ncbi:MAG: SusC/RagA family TonB-linked outer membrane protein [Bacteroidetes bacterium]|nr:SusC/RagA family TonB-linked outer membrane protein [Bacteroidota bacterium]
MRKRLFLVLGMLCFLISQSIAQNIEVTGKVLDDKGTPISGASVNESGSRRGTSTDANGVFKLSVKPGAKLIITSVGYDRREVVATSPQLGDIGLTLGNQALNEVVVTALGVKREKKALGYAVSTVDKKDLELRPDGDVGHLLQGKAPGVNISQSSGISGAQTNIVVRAVSTITGSSTPLFIVDGMVFDGGANNPNGNSGFDYGNQTSSRFLDLDPNNIESISVLKGLSASVLYGENARNGVILVTTKTGSNRRPNKKMEVTVSQSLFVNKVAGLPDYTDKYGGGFDLAPSLAFSNWGAAFKATPDSFNHPYSRAALNAVLPEYVGKKYAYKPYNSVENFFRTGLVKTTNVGMSASGNNTTFNMSYTYMDDKGFLPNNYLRKNNFSMGGTAKLTNKLTMSGTFNYAATDFKTPQIGTSSGSSSGTGSVYGDLMYTPRSIDLMGWPYKNPVTQGSIYYRADNGMQNPRWTAENAINEQASHRFFGNINATYEIMKGLSIAYKFGLDTYDETQALKINKGGTSGGATYINGFYRTIAGTSRILTHNLFATYETSLSSSFNLRTTVGAMSIDNYYSQAGTRSSNQLVFGLFDHSNFVTHDIVSENGSDLDYKRAVKSFGLFGEASLEYKNSLYLNLGARQSWFSTLEKDNRKLFYPSVSVSFLPTSAIEALKNSDVINMLKIRAGYATSANFPSPYQTRPYLQSKTNAFVDASGNVINTGGIPNFSPNPNIRPELLSELEVGIEGSFINRRLTLDLTLFNRSTKDQILNKSLDPSTGYDQTVVNAGTVTNKGIELGLGYTVVRNRNWNWQLQGNFNTYRSRVKDLTEDYIIYAGYSNLGNAAINGKPLGVIMGSAITRDDKSGKRVVDGNGYWLTDPDIKVIGDPNPDYKLTGISTLSYKQFSFRMQWDFTKGGDLYSGTASALLARGVTKDTEFDRAVPTYWKDAVKQDGTPNDIMQSANNLYFSSLGFYVNEMNIFDATLLRLREASLSYALPAQMLDKTPFGAVSITFSGQNLWYNAPNFPKHIHLDPETSSLLGNGRGFEFITGPSSRRYGASIRVSF